MVGFDVKLVRQILDHCCAFVTYELDKANFLFLLLQLKIISRSLAQIVVLKRNVYLHCLWDNHTIILWI